MSGKPDVSLQDVSLRDVSLQEYIEEMFLFSFYSPIQSKLE